MNKQKRIYTICLPILGTFLLAEILLFAFGVISVFAFLGLTLVLGGLIALDIYLLVKAIDKIKKLEKEKEKEKFVSSGNYMQDLYGLLGIPVQYNEDGSVKDIYDLLGLEPIYDDNGDRILTIYELLGIMPMFDQNGKEIPSVLVIKNRVKRFAKVDLSSRVLHRRLTDKEREELLIRQTLRKQMEIAEQNNDKAKVNKIKKVLKEKSEGEEKSKYKTAKSAKAIPSVKLPNTAKEPKVRDLFEPNKKKQQKKVPGKKAPKAGPVNNVPKAEPKKETPRVEKPVVKPEKAEAPGMVFSGSMDARGRVATYGNSEENNAEESLYRS